MAADLIFVYCFSFHCFIKAVTSGNEGKAGIAPLLVTHIEATELANSRYSSINIKMQ